MLEWDLGTSRRESLLSTVLCYAQISSGLFQDSSDGSLVESVPCEAQSTRQLSVCGPGCPSLLVRLLLLQDYLAFAAAVVVGVDAVVVTTVADVLAGWCRR